MGALLVVEEEEPIELDLELSDRAGFLLLVQEALGSTDITARRGGLRR
jgi:hypothetical protein